jgi:signal transduction histidine kinase
MHDKEGKVVASRSVVVDITERKRLDQLKDEFIGLVSHELRSPLTVITGAVNTALTEGERLSPEETRQLLQDAALEAEALSHMLNNLLELSRMQANRLFLHAEVINVGKVIQSAIEEIKRQSSAHQFVVDLPRKLPQVEADELRLERILYNLLENAVKYSPQGGEIRVLAKPEEKHLVIAVSDQGVGISRSDQAQLFAPFQRIENSKLDGVKGAGLGLLVCRRLVEAHGGRIWVESEPGRGATFFFTMPLS